MKDRRRSLNLIHHLNDEKVQWNPWQPNRSKYFQNRFDCATKLSSRDAKGHTGCVNALDFSSDGLRLASGGDDKRVLIWNVSETLFNESSSPPMTLHATHLSNIFSIKFDNHNRRIISAGNDEQILIHDIEKQRSLENTANHSDELVDVFLESSPVNCISIQPDENQIFIAATEDGHVHLYDLRTGPTSSSSVEHDQPSIVVAESFDGSFHSCTFHPQQTCLVATANARQGIELYDIRLSKSPVLRYGESNTYSHRISTSTSNTDASVEGMSVTFNSNGTLLFALRRRLPPVLFKLYQSKAFAQFDANSYVNLCTMKSGCFLGDQDQYIASGSDDFNVYIWPVPKADDCEIIFDQTNSHLSSDYFVWEAHMILRGHRSVVNQVRYSSRLHTLVSSGVEKLVKMWTPYPIHSNENSTSNQPVGREEMFSHRDYLRAVIELGSVHHDSSVEHYDEDRRMLAFFDSLLQRELSNADDEDSPDCSDTDDADDDDEDDDNSSDSNNISFSSGSSESENLREEQLTLEEINSQTVDFAESTLSRSRHPTIVSLAENYRLNYVKMLKEAMGNRNTKPEKRSLDSPPINELKRQRSSSSSTHQSTLQRLRNQIRDEDNEQLYFNDERKAR